MRDIIQDVRFALRTMLKTPAFTMLSVLTIAFGIGASTAVFSMVEGVLLHRLPYASNDRLIHVTQPNAVNPNGAFSVVEIKDYRAQVPELAGVSEYHSMPFQLYGRGEPQRVQTGVVSDNFFTMLGVKPILGRLFLPGEEAIGAPPVVVLSYEYWMNQLGGDRNVIGTTFTMNDRIHTVVGVLPPLPTYPNQNDIFMPAGACPFRSTEQMMNSRQGRMLQMFAAAKPGVSVEQATQAIALVSNRLHSSYPEAYPAARKLRTAVIPLRQEMTQQSRTLLLSLLAMAAFVLLIAAANYTNLLLSRQMQRTREVALRSALGASSGRLLRQLTTESLCVTLSGGLLGIAIAYSGLGLFRSLAWRVTPRADEITIDMSVLAFAIGVSVLVGLAAALVPMVRRGANLVDSLRAGAVATTSGRRDGRARGALVFLQVAVASMVLIGAGLMTRSLIKLQRASAGYDGHNVLTAFVDLNWTRYSTRALAADFADRLIQRLAGTPGVTSVSVSSDFPLNNATPSTQPFLIRGRAPADGAPGPESDVTVVSGGYFKSVGIPLLSGRAFTDAERDTVNFPVVIGQRLANTYWPKHDAIGQQLSIDNGGHWSTVVGVVGDVAQNNLANGVIDEIYLPFFASPRGSLRLLLRTQGDPQQYIAVLRRTIHELDDKQPVTAIQTLEQLRGVRLTEPRVTTALLLSFAILALVITSSGLIGIVGQSVAQRITEIGIRVALGADASRILWAVMRGTVTVVVAGILVGLAAATVTTRVISGLLFQLAPTDAFTYAAVGLALTAVAVAACLLPARRALLIQPIEALRAR